MIKEFDVVAIQEITHATGAGQPVVDGLTAVLRSEFRRTYMSILGPRTGCPGGKEEQYAVLFDTEIVERIK